MLRYIQNIRGKGNWFVLSLLWLCSIGFSTVVSAQTAHRQNFNIVWEYEDAKDVLKLADMEAERVGRLSSHDKMLYYAMEVELQAGETLDSLQLHTNMWEGVKLAAQDAQAIDDFWAHNKANDIALIIKNKPNRRYAIVYFPVLEQSVLPGVYNRLMSGEISYVKTLSLDPKEAASLHSLRDSIFATSSVFATGDWYQMRIDKNGVYKLTTEQLVAMGIDVANINANQIKVYGFGGMIDEENSGLHYSDIPEVAIQVHDGGDGKMNAGDYILFYAQGPNMWHYYKSLRYFYHTNNHYSDYSYYYVRVSPEVSKTIETVANANDYTNEVNSFVDYGLIEDELVNLGQFGKVWFGDEFDFTPYRDYSFKFENLVPNSDVFFSVRMAAKANVLSKFTFTYNGLYRDIGFRTPGTGDPAVFGDLLRWRLKLANTNPIIPFSIEYNHPITNSTAWLDYVEINVERYLKFGTAEQQAFRVPKTVGANKITKFNITNASAGALQIWDITDPIAATAVTLESIANDQKCFILPTDYLREFVAFDVAAAYIPKFVAHIPNQNLHAEFNHDYIIISHKNFLAQANELADYHRQYNDLDVYVVDVDKVYHEYSSGRLDPGGIRDFLRSQYNNSDPDKLLKYVLLFGDASYDYKNIEKENGNFIPSYIFEDNYTAALDIGSSIVTDDFFAFMDEDEGFGDNFTETIDLGIGRFPVTTVAQAQTMVDKVKHYDKPSDAVMSDWRNIVTLTCDDEQGNHHFDRAEAHARTIRATNPNFNIDKIYLGSYPQVTTSAGQRAPMVNEAINNRIEKGTLILGYSGHGGETGLTDERIMDLPDIKNWKNWDKLFVMLTATCEFSRFDDHTRISAGEYALLNDKGGSIALFTTTRPTYPGSNKALSRLFYLNALKKYDGKSPTFGDISFKIKQGGSHEGNQKFVLLGDPAVRLKIPDYKVITESVINNSSGAQDSLQAFANVTVTGRVIDNNGQLMSQFNGHVYPTIFDKPGVKLLLETDTDAPETEYLLQNNIIYKGNIGVTDGEFSFDFVVPKDIVFTQDYGKISYYASDGKIDAVGIDTNIVVGGYAPNYIQDKSGPHIRLFINDTTFTDGGVTNENPILLAEVTDENGVNTTGTGIGHELVAVLDGNTKDIRVLNDYYIPKLNSYKSGYIQYPFHKLSDGEHSIMVRVWDVYNNSSKATIHFQVVSSSSISIEELFNYPNPVGDQTTFSFQHNQSEEDMQVQLEIYDMQGRLVNVLKDKVLAGGYHSNNIRWDVTDAQGTPLSKGMYLYRLLLKTNTGKTAEKTAKLVVVK